MHHLLSTVIPAQANPKTDMHETSGKVVSSILRFGFPPARETTGFNNQSWPDKHPRIFRRPLIPVSRTLPHDVQPSPERGGGTLVFPRHRQLPADFGFGQRDGGEGVRG